MLVSVCTYRVRAGNEDAIAALYAEWQLHLRFNAEGYVSGELLSSPEDPGAFVEIVRYDSEEARRAVAETLHYHAWHHHLMPLIEEQPVLIECRTHAESGNGFLERAGFWNILFESMLYRTHSLEADSAEEEEEEVTA